MAFLELKNISKSFAHAKGMLKVLEGITFDVEEGEFVAIVGPSGCGKSTLLRIINGIVPMTSGQVLYRGRQVDGINLECALVFQSFALLPMLSAAENVGIPMRLARRPSAVREKRARDLLRVVGLEGREHLRPYELSGGEQQRVAIARGLANNATLLLADEPTGQLDKATGAQIMTLLRRIVHAEGMTGVVATHDKALIDIADRVLTVANGVVTAA
jgi:putative ABC transport system ATP-binding protein